MPGKIIAFTQSEIALVNRLCLSSNWDVGKIERRSHNEYDLTIKGKYVGQKTLFEAWLPLAALYEEPWGAWVQDWSMIRDAAKEEIWTMFYQNVLKRKVA